MKPRKSPKLVTVVSTEALSKNIQRIVFSADELHSFDENCAGQYIKLLFNQKGGTELPKVSLWSKPSMRTYTIRSFDRANLLMSVDFVVHRDGSVRGLACDWALRAKAGDTITIAGPGNGQVLPTGAQNYLLFGDMTSLPAIAVMLERLSANAVGQAFIQVESESDIQKLAKPLAVEIHWLIANPSSSVLLEAVESIPTSDQIPAIWCACDFNQMRAIRSIVTKWSNFNRELTYFSSYWKPGVTEDGHKALKQQDQQQRA
ncbi:siderophore-interacting protein [Alginatibacterium sediminis]|nr:siderophore-interacting protein [Alginatibacterium sediminis]